MGRPSEADLELGRQLTVALILAVRREYLQTAQANMLTHWDQITERMRACARTCASAEEWTTKLIRDLRIPSPGKDLSSGISAVTSWVRTHHAEAAWLGLIEREYGYLIACARLESERRREARA